jgi:hypothetical protein
MKRLCQLAVAHTFVAFHGLVHGAALWSTCLPGSGDAALRRYDGLCALSWRVLGVGDRLLARLNQ